MSGTRPVKKIRKLLAEVQEISEKYEYIPGYGLKGDEESVNTKQEPFEMDLFDFAGQHTKNEEAFEWEAQKKQIFRDAVAQAGHELTLAEAGKLNAFIDEHFQGKVKSEEQLRDFEYLWELECYK